MGGVGKTTLAQLAYNDARLEGKFDLKAWVCVSEEFDVTMITKEILLSVDVEVGNDNSLNRLQEKLKKQLFRKKFLLVLDDIWNENSNDWTVLKRPFEAASSESKIIVTTRNQDVSTMMGTLPAYQLKELSNEACLHVFTQYALGRVDFSMHQNLKEIGEKIVRKCNGLPLAAETLGGLLRGKVDISDWENVLNSQIWDLSEERSNILPALRISYYYLPSHLKRCFAYCSVFPKDYEFSKDEMVLLWMAEGLLQHKNSKKRVEDLGYEFFRDLESRSFFQQSGTGFVMHDLINVLAQWAAGEICFRTGNTLDSDKQWKSSKNLRHLSYIRGSFDRAKKFETLSDAKYLRTFLPVELPTAEIGYLPYYVLNKLPKLHSLRVLSLRGYQIYKLPDSIGELSHLRYLDLSRTEIETLPESISCLYNLETLLLERCSRLKKLCTDMGNLINLRVLNNAYAHALEEMPLGIGKLTGLVTLPNFVVGNGSSIGELKSLTHIRDKLCISGLQDAHPLDAKKADLDSKRNLKVLALEWFGSISDSRELEDQTVVLDMLRPHPDLKELTLSGYGGTTFPSWLGDSSFLNLVQLTFENISKCTSLPSVGKLPLLKNLVIKRMDGVKIVGWEFCTCSEPFPSLETLSFEDMQEWEEWILHRPDQEAEVFPCLRKLSIVRCPKLVGRLPECLLSLERLVIRSCDQLSVKLPSLPRLCRLEIEGCKQVEQRSVIDLSTLNSIVISDILPCVYPTERFTQGLSKVEELKIVGCQELTSLWQNNIELLQDNSSLRRLVIERCPQFLCLLAEEEEEEQQQELHCRLQYLKLKECESFVKLPQALCSLSFLTEISIIDCPKLVSFPETGMPTQLRVVEIDKCNSLKSLPVAWTYNSNTCLESLSVKECHGLTYIARVQLPPNLKQLVVNLCRNLWTLVDEEGIPMMQKEITNSGNSRNKSLLEKLEIGYCPYLRSLWSKTELPATLEHITLSSCACLSSLSSSGILPKALKHLMIYDCSKLESIGKRLQNNTSLERIQIHYCNNLKLLPEDLHNLSHLQEITISYCPNIISFPEGGLPSMNLTALSIYNCEELETLPNQVHNLTSLNRLTIENCPSMVSFPVHGFPTNLTLLNIKNVEICKNLFNWGLHRLTSLRDLRIAGGCLEVLSFPQEEIGMMLPTSLTGLKIENFPNLDRISSNIQNLTSLETLYLKNCSKLKSFPKEGLPSSLLRLFIAKCPMLKRRCKKEKGQYWNMIAHIPYVEIDSRLAYI